MATPKASGFKLSFAAAKGKPGLKASIEKPAKRPRLALGDDEPEDDNKKQEISGWDAAEGGAVDASGKKEVPKGPRVIPAVPNRHNRLPYPRQHPDDAQRGGRSDTAGELEGSKPAYGLTVPKKETSNEDDSAEAKDTNKDVQEENDGLTEEQRLEKNALDALLNGKSADQTVIPFQTEEEAFQHDLQEAPEAPTLEAYEATPVEGFGAALLRGMGWKDGEGIGRDKGTTIKPIEIKRRPALLGVGAKESSAVGIELGEWGGGKGNKKKPALNYNPVTLRNKHTGEMITEDELKGRLEAQKMVDEKPSKSSRYDGEEEDERRREKRKERRDRDRDRRDDDYDSERRQDRDRGEPRRRDRDRDREDDYSDRERRRDKRRYRDEDYSDSDRRRDKQRDRDRRDRSRSRDDDDRRREKRRDRDRRDRDRDRDRGRDRSNSRDSELRRKRRREYDDVERDDRKRRVRDERDYDRR